MGNKILIIDDVKKNIQLLGSILGNENYAVSYATNGAKALAMTDTDTFDLILLDVMMPEMDGFEVCRRLKKKENTRDIPILFLTAKSEQSDIVDGLQQGAVDYLTKPFNPAELIARVKTHIDLREAHQIIMQRNTQLEEKTEELQKLIEENRKAISEIKILRGFLPICSKCKKIRDDDGYWTQLESYIRDHSEAQFTHSICQDCAKELYPFMKDPK
jgi:phosphoserine phosphatase RsbU/P